MSSAEGIDPEAAFQSALNRSRPAALKGLRRKYSVLAGSCFLGLAGLLVATEIWSPPLRGAVVGAVLGAIVGLALNVSIGIIVTRKSSALLLPDRRATIKRGVRATTNGAIARAGLLISVVVVAAWVVWPPIACFGVALYATAMLGNAIKYYKWTDWFGPESLDSDVYTYSIRHPEIELSAY